MTTVFLISGTSYTIPSGVSTLTTLQGIGGASSGGGEFRQQNAVSVTAGIGYSYVIGAGASPATSNGGATSWNTNTIIANGGGKYGPGGTGGTGSSAHADGGLGGAGIFRRGGGGGGGPQGAGGAYTSVGTGHGGLGDTAVAASIGGDLGLVNTNPTAGGAGASFGSGHGAGGGGGGAGGGSSVNGANGGLYGGGGGSRYGGGGTYGTGAQGIIVLTFTAAPTFLAAWAGKSSLIGVGAYV